MEISISITFTNAQYGTYSIVRSADICKCINSLYRKVSCYNLVSKISKYVVFAIEILLHNELENILK